MDKLLGFFMLARIILTLAFLLGIALAVYILYGTKIVAQLASAGDHQPETELNAPEDVQFGLWLSLIHI